jgi:hypothetical protein
MLVSAVFKTLEQATPKRMPEFDHLRMVEVRMPTSRARSDLALRGMNK